MANQIEIGNKAIVLSDPDDTEIARVSAAFEALLRETPEVTIAGVFGRWTMNQPFKVLFVGPDYVDVDMSYLSAAAGDAQRPVRLKVSEGRRVKVRFKIPTR